MKAARLNEWGKAIVIEDVDQPEPGDDEVLVRIHAASVNPFDNALHAGYLQGMASVPMTMGTDFAGEVATVGKNITDFKPGDQVFGSSPLGRGTFAEYVLVKPHELARKPRSVDYVSSAAVPLSSMAAWISLFDELQVQPGEKLLIIGAAGNVGSIATQLAKEKGVYVYGVDIPEKAEHILALGLDKFIPHTERFEDHVQDVNAVLDLVGGEMTGRAYNVLKPGGRYVTSLEAEPAQEEPNRRGIHSMGLGAFPRAEVLASMAEHIDTGRMRVTINRTFPLEEVNEAMMYRMQTRAPGKVVISLMQ
jgi:NADPH:quinone reductase-like Zn-dependent oxidoreductase